MNRLTEKFMDKIVLPNIPMEIKNKKDLDNYHEVRRDIENKIIKLAAYEDTGLEPEDILSNIKTLSSELNNAFDELKECRRLEEQGLLIKLVCPIGTKLYYISHFEEDFKSKVRECYMAESNVFIINRRFGKDIFLTREEAEKALNKEVDIG